MDPRQLLRRPSAWAIAALATHSLLLAVLPAASRVNESTDFRDFYAPVAYHLLAGDGLIDAEGRPATRYPPGYPVVLATAFGLADSLPGRSAFWLGLLDSLAIAATGALVFLVARRIAGARAAPWAAALWVTYLPFLWLGKQPNSETPFLPVMLGAVAAWLVALDERDQRAAWLAGGLLGVATLIRPVTLLLAVPLAVSALVRFRAPADRRLGRRLATWIVIAQFLVLLPWELWAHQATGRWLPVSDGGRLSLLDGLTFAIDPQADRDAVSPAVAALMDDIQEHRRSLGGPADAARFFADHDDASAVVELLGVKAVRAWFATDSMRHETPLAILQIGYLSLAALGLWLGRGRPRHLLVAALVIVYFWGMAWLVLSILRYMVPAMALVMPFAGDALAVAYGRLRGRAE